MSGTEKKPLAATALVPPALFAVAYFAAAEAGHALSFPGDFASFWPPSGLYVAALLVTPPRRWPLYGLAALAGNQCSDVLLHGKAPAVSLAFWAANTLEAAAAAWLLLRFGGGAFALDRLRNVLAFCSVSALGSTALSATVGAATVTAAFGGPYGSAWLTWWSSGAIGVLVVGPLVLTLLQEAPRRRPVRPGRAAEAALLMASLGLTAEFVFGRQVYPLAWLVTPFLLWAALRFEVSGVGCAVGVLAVVAVWNTSRGHGPFAAAWPGGGEVLVVQLFVSTCATAFLVVGAVVKERGQATEAVRASEARYHDLFENMSELVSFVGPDARPLYVNRAWHQLLGYDADALGALTVFDLIHPDDHACCREYLRRLLAGEALERVEVRLVTRGGEERMLEGDSSPQFDGGRVVGIRSIYRDITERRRAELEVRRLQEELRRRIVELEAALGEVKQLSGLLPMCAWCKKIRDDQDYWHDVETYVAAHTQANFTHGMCPHCYEKNLREGRAAVS